MVVLEMMHLFIRHLFFKALALATNDMTLMLQYVHKKVSFLTEVKITF